MPRRRSNRMPGHDYASPGAYFVTTCADMRLPVFGFVEGSVMRFSGIGKIVDESLGGLGEFMPGITVAAKVVMPNHVHAVIHLNHVQGVEKNISLPDIMRRFKAYTSKEFLAGAALGLWSPLMKTLWQRGYHDIIIRHVRDEDRLRRYIANNPISWERDKLNPNWQLASNARIANRTKGYG